MKDAFAQTFTIATRSDDLKSTLTRVNDAKRWPSAPWLRRLSHHRPARYIDLNDL